MGLGYLIRMKFFSTASRSPERKEASVTLIRPADERFSSDAC